MKTRKHAKQRTNVKYKLVFPNAHQVAGTNTTRQYATKNRLKQIAHCHHGPPDNSFTRVRKIAIHRENIPLLDKHTHTHKQQSSDGLSHMQWCQHELHDSILEIGTPKVRFV